MMEPLQLLFTTGVHGAGACDLAGRGHHAGRGHRHIDPDYEKAAESLGAGPVRVFLTVTLPLSGPGIVAGLTTAFAWTFSAFATPQLVGGGKVNMVSNLVYQLASRISTFRSRRRFASRGCADLCVDLPDATSLRPLEKVGCTDWRGRCRTG